MLSSSIQRSAGLIALSHLLLLQFSSTNALWIPEELKKDTSFWVAEDFTPFTKRQESSTCGGLSGLSTCGNGFPSDFCCGEQAECLRLNTTSSITAAMCCPAGQDCATISTVSCDQRLQNATSNPRSQLHSEPTAELEKCGEECCPMGYKCDGGNCKAITAEEAAASASTTSASSTPTPTSTSTLPSSEAASETAKPTQIEDDSGSFSGKSFAAGFVPGIALGLLAAALIVFFLIRKRRRGEAGHVDEKRRPHRDTLTDLGPDVYRRPTVHGRSISEPNVDTSAVHRTEFLHYSPPSQKMPNDATGYVVQVTSPASQQQPKQKGWFSHSPFVNQVQTPKPTHSPIPAHLKRGTLSFAISPVRALKKQRSMHSLRRQMTSATTGSNSSRGRPSVTRTGSTETIKVAMATPDQSMQQLPPTSFNRTPDQYIAGHREEYQRGHPLAASKPPLSATTWQTTTSGVSSESSTPIDEEPDYTTPTRPGRNSNVINIGASLQNPYTPSNYGTSSRLPDGYGPSNSYAANAQALKASLGDGQRRHDSVDTADVAPLQPKARRNDFLAPPPPVPPIPGQTRGHGETDPETGRMHLRLSSMFPGNGRDSFRDTMMTTWGGMMEKTGITKSVLYGGNGNGNGNGKGDKLVTKGGDPREWNRK